MPEIAECLLDRANCREPLGPRLAVIVDRLGRCLYGCAQKSVAVKQLGCGGFQTRILGDKALNLEADQAIAGEFSQQLIERPWTQPVQRLDIAIEPSVATIKGLRWKPLEISFWKLVGLPILDRIPRSQPISRRLASAF
jgi:hypothetical protein